LIEEDCLKEGVLWNFFHRHYTYVRLLGSISVVSFFLLLHQNEVLVISAILEHFIYFEHDSPSLLDTFICFKLDVFSVSFA